LQVPCGWVVDPACCSSWDTLDPGVQANAERYAIQVIWARTGRRFGLCEKTVRPCGRYITPWPSIAGFEYSAGTWMIPFIDGLGAWRNCVCPSECCTCRPLCEVLLPAPVNSVSEVVVDGVVITDTAYRVDDYRWLVRTDGGCWPDCVDYNVDSGEGFFEVTYLKGWPVPDDLLVAAGTLACEFAKACIGDGTCRLPGRIRSLTRTGIEVSFTDTDTLLRNGLTGIIEVDQLLMAYNPNNLARGPRVWTPSNTPPRIVTSP